MFWQARELNLEIPIRSASLTTERLGPARYKLSDEPRSDAAKPRRGDHPDGVTYFTGCPWSLQRNPDSLSIYIPDRNLHPALNLTLLWKRHKSAQSANSYLTIHVLHERPAVMDQIQIDQLFLEIFPGWLIKTRAHFGDQVSDEFAPRPPESLAQGSG
jgi:hypothetical protein